MGVAVAVAEYVWECEADAEAEAEAEAEADIEPEADVEADAEELSTVGCGWTVCGWALYEELLESVSYCGLCVPVVAGAALYEEDAVEDGMYVGLSFTDGAGSGDCEGCGDCEIGSADGCGDCETGSGVRETASGDCEGCGDCEIGSADGEATSGELEGRGDGDAASGDGETVGTAVVVAERLGRIRGVRVDVALGQTETV